MSRTRLFAAVLLFCACNPKAPEGKDGDPKVDSSASAKVDLPAAEPKAKQEPAQEQKTGDARIFTAEGDRVVEGPFPASELNPELTVLAKAVVAELNANSTDGLKALLIEKEEYEQIFPDVAANRLTSKIGWEYSWDDMTVETKDEIKVILAKHGDRDLVYSDASVTTLIERTNVRLYRKVVLEVYVQGKDKEVERLGILGTMVEERESGDLSLLSYRIFQPTPANRGEESLNSPPSN